MKPEVSKSSVALMGDVAKLIKKHKLIEGRLVLDDDSQIISNKDGTFLLRRLELWSQLKS